MARWRGLELWLLAYPAGLLLIGLAMLTVVQGGQVAVRGLGSGFMFAVLLLVAHVWLIWRLPGADQVLLPIGAGLAAIGQVMIARLSPDLAPRQAAWVASSR